MIALDVIDPAREGDGAGAGQAAVCSTVKNPELAVVPRDCDESSECAAARQHKVAEVAWLATEPISVLELTQTNEVDGWGVVTYMLLTNKRLKSASTLMPFRPYVTGRLPSTLV